MQRSKQQAMMFLLGAVLVGGVLGFSADRLVKKKERSWVQRVSFYDEFKITADQRKKMDSIFDESNCKTEEVMKPIKAELDSVRAQARRDYQAVMTDAQRTAVAAKEAQMKARRDSVERVRAAERAAKGQSAERPIARCGGPMRGPGMGPSGPGGPGGPGGGPDRRGPGGPFRF